MFTFNDECACVWMFVWGYIILAYMFLACPCISFTERKLQVLNPPSSEKAGRSVPLVYAFHCRVMVQHCWTLTSLCTHFISSSSPSTCRKGSWSGASFLFFIYNGSERDFRCALAYVCTRPYQAPSFRPSTHMGEVHRGNVGNARGTHGQLARALPSHPGLWSSWSEVDNSGSVVLWPARLVSVTN